MRLTALSLFLAAYALARFVLPSRHSVLPGLLVIAASLKYTIYERIGGFVFAPAFPDFVILGMEFAYAALLFLVVLLLLRDLWGLLFWALRLGKRGGEGRLSADRQRLAIAFAALLFALWGVWQAVRVPDVRTLEVALPNLPPELEGFSVVQISDLHMGPVLKKAWLESVVGRVNALQPDLVLITGDMVEGRVDEIGPELTPLAKLSARHGVFGVTGNHEYFYDARAWTRFFEALGVTMLTNEHRVVNAGKAKLVVAGVPDRRGGKFGDGFPDADRAFEGAPAGVPRLLMSHRPGETAGHEGFDLQLSGHTHGGTLFFAAPMIAQLNGGFVRGLYRVGGRQIYVSPGTGIWNGFSCRLGVPSEITRILLRSRPEDGHRKAPEEPKILRVLPLTA